MERKEWQALGNCFVAFALSCGFLAWAGVTTGMAAEVANKNRQVAPTAKNAPSDGVNSVLAEPPLSGPKKRIAISKFAATSDLAYRYSRADIGGGIAEQLATELVNTGRFIVVERGALDGILQEQELGAKKFTTKETAAQAGQLLGAQPLITGAVTEFTQEANRRGLRLGIGGFSRIVDNMGVGLDVTTGHVALDVRLIEATTGQVLQSFRAKGKASGRGASVQLDTNRMNLGGDLFHETPLGIGHATGPPPGGGLHRPEDGGRLLDRSGD